MVLVLVLVPVPCSRALFDVRVVLDEATHRWEPLQEIIVFRVLESRQALSQAFVPYENMRPRVVE